MVNQIKSYLLEMFSDLRFDEARHLYFVNGENYPSVSKKLEDHYEKFNRELWLERCAIKESKEQGRIITTEELGKKWDNKRDVACDMGHDTHFFMEHFTPGKEHLADIPQKKAGLKFLFDVIYKPDSRYEIITHEFRMINRRFKYCGTTDLLLWDKWEECIIIIDWKTNEDLFKTYGYLLAPFQFLESNPFNKYQLQFNYYQLCIEQGKYRVGNRWLVYLGADENYEVCEVKDLTKELTQYLEQPNKIEAINYGLVW